MFYLLHGVGKSYRINIQMVACIGWRPGDEDGAVFAEVTFSGGAKVELAVPSPVWSRFLDEVGGETRGVKLAVKNREKN